MAMRRSCRSCFSSSSPASCPLIWVSSETRVPSSLLSAESCAESSCSRSWASVSWASSAARDSSLCCQRSVVCCRLAWVWASSASRCGLGGGGRGELSAVPLQQGLGLVQLAADLLQLALDLGDHLLAGGQLLSRALQRRPGAAQLGLHRRELGAGALERLLLLAQLLLGAGEGLLGGLQLPAGIGQVGLGAAQVALGGLQAGLGLGEPGLRVREAGLGGGQVGLGIGQGPLGELQLALGLSQRLARGLQIPGQLGDAVLVAHDRLGPGLEIRVALGDLLAESGDLLLQALLAAAGVLQLLVGLGQGLTELALRLLLGGLQLRVALLPLGLALGARLVEGLQLGLQLLLAIGELGAGRLDLALQLPDPLQVLLDGGVELRLAALVALEGVRELPLEDAELLRELLRPLLQGLAGLLQIQAEAVALLLHGRQGLLQLRELLAEPLLELGLLLLQLRRLRPALLQLIGEVGDLGLELRDAAVRLQAGPIQGLLQGGQRAGELGDPRLAVGGGLREILLGVCELLARALQLLLAGQHVVLERALAHLALEGGDVELPLELLELLLLLRELLAALGELLLAAGQLAAQDVELLLLGRDGLDDLLLADELLLQQLLDGGAVLALALLEGALGLQQPALQVLELHLDALDLDVLVVEPILDGEQLPLADAPDLGDARDLRLADLELVAEDLDLALGRALQLGARRAALELAGLGQQLGLAVREGLEGAVHEGPVLLGDRAAALAAGQLGRRPRGRSGEGGEGRRCGGRGAGAGEGILQLALQGIRGHGRGAPPGPSG